jgi:hypothetical protein
MRSPDFMSEKMFNQKRLKIRGNVACRKGFEPPTFGSRVPYSILQDKWENPGFSWKMPYSPLSNTNQS